jgi:Fur family ferric uptake transcriptional regulator
LAELRKTPQRRVILELLLERRWHPTADELFHAVRRRLPRVSLGTVYRNLEILSEAGVIGRIESVAGPRRYDGCVEKHTHVRCLRCGSLEDLSFNGPPLGDVLKSLTGGSERTKSGFRITGHRVEFEGICPRCGTGEGRDRGEGVG